MKTDHEISSNANPTLPRAGGLSNSNLPVGNAGDALTSAVHNTANDAADAAKRGLNKLVDRAESVAHGSMESVNQLARKGTELAKQGAEKAKSLAQRCNDATCAYVVEQPMKSVLISAAMGAALTALLLTSMRRRRY
jgi:ElaB/YqjD/DUF883 family membrane-anchored ribosome-binding protein